MNLLFCLAALASAGAKFTSKGVTFEPANYTDRAAQTAAVLQSQFYNSKAHNNIYGFAWWQDAATMETLCNFMLYTNSTKYLDVVESIFDRDAEKFRIGKCAIGVNVVIFI